MDEHCEHCSALRLYLEAQVDALTTRFLQYTEYNNDRLQRTERDLERRLEGMNEFRSQLTQQANTFLTREYYDVQRDAIDKRLVLIERGKGILDGQIALLGVLVVLALQTITLVWRLWGGR